MCCAHPRATWLSEPLSVRGPRPADARLWFASAWMVPSSAAEAGLEPPSTATIVKSAATTAAQSERCAVSLRARISMRPTCLYPRDQNKGTTLRGPYARLLSGDREGAELK